LGVNASGTAIRAARRRLNFFVKDRQGYSSSGARSRDAENREAGATARLGTEEHWLPHLFELAGIPSDASLETIQSEMDALANRAAPRTRQWWKWILLFQALAVCIPLAWLVQRFLVLPVELVGLASLCAALILMAAIWWLRWRGMQKTWARSRLVAEAARSLIATAHCAGVPGWRSLSIVPSLRPLRSIAANQRSTTPFTEWRDRYIENRIDDQQNYFAKKQREAEARREQFSRWTTLLLDLLMIFAIGGAVVVITPVRADHVTWLSVFGDELLEVTLGIAGTVFAVCLLVIQNLREIQDLNRQTARFAQQRRMLGQARLRLAHARSEEEAAAIVDDTESELLAEVLEWYFRAETAEHFAGIRSAESGLEQAKPIAFKKSRRATVIVRRVAGWTGIAGLFVLRVILGRIAWILASAIVVIGWIAFYMPTHGADVRLIKKSKPQLFSADLKNLFAPHSKHGCIVLVHGLYGSAIWKGEDPRDWMTPCAKAIAKRLESEGKPQPDICLVDWKNSAFPSKHYGLPVFGEKNLVSDLAAIRPQAYQVGNEVAVQLARLMIDGKIDKQQPIHLIGHSAGGFIVTRIATRLNELGLLLHPHQFHITILDTPAPDSEILEEMPKVYPSDAVDFYVTSRAGGLEPNFHFASFPREIHWLRVLPEQKARRWWEFGTGLRDDHQYAYKWFIQTAADPNATPPHEGFNRSPLLLRSD
jgi:pimeloyl-ACP methyl ester carboxylesterase